MPAKDRKNPEDKTTAGRMVKFLYCPDCLQYSGGFVCRQCRRGLGQFVPPTGEKHERD